MQIHTYIHNVECNLETELKFAEYMISGPIYQTIKFSNSHFGRDWIFGVLQKLRVNPSCNYRYDSKQKRHLKLTNGQH
jgi:hypothetical protein